MMVNLAVMSDQETPDLNTESKIISLESDSS